VVLHHILVRAQIPLPHTLHGWQAAEYVRWVEEHSEEEALTLIEGGLTHWKKTCELEGSDPAATYLSLARNVLANAKAELCRSEIKLHSLSPFAGKHL
jgi:conserved oligomeric Golgi complex subunit 5